MGRRRDALLTLAVLLPAGAAAVALDAPVTPLAVVAGIAGTLAFEALLSLRAARVRAVWERSTVQAATVLLGVAAAALAVAVLGPVTATVLVAGLCAYLAVLTAVTLRDALERSADSEPPPSDARRPPRK